MKLLTGFIKKLLKFNPWQMAAVITLMILAAGSEGISLLFLKPLLELASNNTSHSAAVSHASSSIPIATTVPASPIASSDLTSNIFSNVFHALHLSDSLIKILMLYVVILSSMAILNYTKNRLNGVLQLNFAYDLQKKLYNNFILSSWQNIANTKRSDFNQLLTHEIDRVSFGIDMLIQLISTSILTAIYIFMAALISWQLTLIAFGCALLLYFALHLQNAIAFKLGKKNYAYFRQLYSSINDNLVGAKLAKSYCLEGRLMQQFHKTAHAIVKLSSKFIGVQETNTLSYTIGGAVTFGTIFYFSISDFNISLASLFVLLVIFARLVPRVSALQRCGQNLIKTLVSFAAVDEMTQQFFMANKEALYTSNFCQQDTHQDTQQNKQKIVLKKSLRLENITFAYDKTTKYILNSFNLTIPAQQITALIGPSGVGKSTLIDIIIGLLEPSEGIILLDDKPLTTENMQNWRHSIAYVPQNDYLLNDTIRNNLTWVLDDAANITEDDIHDALQKAGIYNFIQELPDKLETKVGDDGFSLSGGEKQRIMLARALLRKPSLLILDEATNSLDQNNENLIFETITKLRGYLTVVMATHHKEVLKFADTIFFLPNAAE